MSCPRPVARARLLVLCLLAAALVAAPVHGQDDTPDDGARLDFVSMRTIAVDDFWTYRSTGQDEGTIHNVIEALETKTNHWGQRYEVFRVHSSGDLQSTQETEAGLEVEVHVQFEVEKWVRSRDYATVHILGQTTIEERFQQAKRSTTEESFSPPLVETIYPFTDGYSWKTESKWYNKRGSEEPQERLLDYRATVLGTERVRVPAGEFDAWKVEVRSGRSLDSVSYQWYAPEACDLVKELRVDDAGQMINQMVLTDHRCDGAVVEPQPTYDPNHVRLLSRGVAAGTDDPGPSFRVGVEQEDAPGAAVPLVLAALGGLLAAARRPRT